ncbi:nuclease [Arthrobacter phage Atuin]|nr:nuclease [Arthrobacter phage Atuin]
MIYLPIDIDYIKTNPGYEYTSRVHRWVDGDTTELDIIIPLDLGFSFYEIKILKMEFRLIGIDTPERGKPNYNEAREFAESYGAPGTILRAKTYKVEDYGIAEKYGRYLVELFAGDTSINQALVATGFAKIYDGGKKS